jgi:predicted transposase YbfD/YdcC
MDCSTTSMGGVEGRAFAVGSLLAAVAKEPDRRKRRGVRYALPIVLGLLVLAKLAGQDHPTGMAQWALERADWLIQAFGLKRTRLPHRTTYLRVLHHMVSVDDLERVVDKFLAEQPPTGLAVVISLDGKTLRGTIPPGETRGMHLLAGYLPEVGVVLLQMQVDRKENEIVAAQPLLEAMDLDGKIVRADALLTQRGLSAYIVTQGGDYVWLAKDNQPQLHQDIAAVFASTSCAPGHNTGPQDFQTVTTINKGHGRTEKRTLTTGHCLKGYNDWPGLEQVFQLERDIRQHRSGETRRDVGYGLTSLTATQAGPRRLLDLVRIHWGMENGLHYRRDVTFGEDACCLRRGPAPRIVAILNNLVLELLLTHGVQNVPQARRHFDGCPNDALALLFNGPA